jgi:hypothetical protein
MSLEWNGDRTSYVMDNVVRLRGAACLLRVAANGVGSNRNVGFCCTQTLNDLNFGSDS